MNLVWAVVKGDLLTTVGWAAVYLLGALAWAKWRAWRSRRSAPENFHVPAWARRALSPEAKFKVATMRRRRRRSHA